MALNRAIVQKIQFNKKASTNFQLKKFACGREIF
jgi:hypothetical protein